MQLFKETDEYKLFAGLRGHVPSFAKVRDDTQPNRSTTYGSCDSLNILS
jgi:hypothetical protein